MIDLLHEEPLTEEDFEGGSVSEKGKQALQNLHDLEVLGALIKAYVEGTKGTLYEIAKAKGLENKETKTYGNTTVKYVAETKTKRFDSKQFKADYPEIAENYTVEGTRRGHIEVTYDE